MITFRNYIVNLLRYMPEHLQKDPEINALLKVESAEHILQEETLQDIFRQFFVSTATWGLALWENDLAIVPKPTDDYTQRRNRIYLKLQSKQTSTKEFMAKLAARYFSEDAIIEPKEDNPNDMFWIIDHGGRLLYPEDFFEAIDTYIPAHLGFGLRLDWTLDWTSTEDVLRVGMATVKETFQSVGVYLPDEEKQRVGIALLGGVAGVKNIGAAPNNPQEVFPLGVQLGHIRGGRLNIGADLADLNNHFKEILGNAYMLPRMGIMAVAKGIRRIPIIPNQAGRFAISISQIVGQKGKRRYGLAPPKNEEALLRAGTAKAISGRREIQADKSELSEHFKEILGNAYMLPRIATGSAEAGYKAIGIQKPEQAGIQLMSGFFHALGGFVKIGAGEDDLDECFKDILGDAKMPLRAGVIAVTRSRKRVPPMLPENGSTAYQIGLATAQAGNKKMSLSLPPTHGAKLGAGMMIQRGGYTVIGANREDSPIPRREMPHVGLMQIGTLAVG